MSYLSTITKRKTKMKKLTLMLALAVVSFVSQAQTLTNKGWCSGKYYFTVTGVSVGDNITVSLTGNEKWPTTGTSDSSFIVSAVPFTLAVPQPTQSGTYKFNFNDVTTNTNTKPTTGSDNGVLCTVTPVKWGTFAGTVDHSDSTLVNFSWTTYMEYNVKSFVLLGSTDGKSWDVLQTIAPTNQNSGQHTYNISFRDPLVAVIVKTAGFGLLGAILIGLVFAGSFRNRVIATSVACIMILGAVACTKHNDLAPNQERKYTFFKVAEIDMDNGSLTTGTAINDNAATTNVVYIGK